MLPETRLPAITADDPSLPARRFALSATHRIPGPAATPSDSSAASAAPLRPSTRIWSRSRDDDGPGSSSALSSRAMRSGDGKWLALLIAVPLLLFAGVLLSGEGFYVRDVIRDYLPSRAILQHILRRGEFPFWNRFLSAGQPLAANPGFQTFYPGTWLIALAGFPLGFHLEIVLHIALAAAGMFLLLRSLRLSIPSALFGAASFGFGGAVLSLTNLVPFLTSMAWWPLLLLFGGRVVRDGRRRDAAALALVLGMLFLAAEQSMLIQTAMLLLSIAVKERASLQRTWRIVLLACLLGFAIGSVQILPALDLMRDSSRGRGVSYEDATSWSMPAVRPLELVFPHAFGRITNEGSQYRGAWRYRPARVPLIFSLYCGLLVPLLVVTGLLLRMPMWKWTLSLTAVSYLVAIGSHGPIAPILFSAGLLRGVRYPEKFILLGLFACVVFASLVFERLRERAVHSRLKVLTALVSLIAAVALVITPGVARMDFGPAMAIAVGIGATALLFQRKPQAIPLILLVITLADLGLHVRELAPTMPAPFFAPPPAVAALSATRGPSRMFHAASWPVWGDGGTAIRGGRETYWSQRATLPPFTAAMYGLQSAVDLDINLTNLKPTADFVQSFWEVSSHRIPFDALLPMANVSSVVVPANDGVKIVRVASNPRYQFASAMESVTSRDEFVRKLSSRRWDPRTAFVTRQPFAPAPGHVRRVDEQTNEARIEVEAAGPAFLMISVTPHRYWKGSIDGVATPLEIVNLGFQGLVVPAGHHIIRMTYRNPLIGICGAISLIGLMLACVGCVWANPRQDPTCLSVPSPVP